MVVSTFVGFLIVILESILAGIYINRIPASNGESDRNIPIYLVIFILSQFFQIVFLGNAVSFARIVDLDLGTESYSSYRSSDLYALLLCIFR
jgi:hypothetical protein